jgi:hypothetical protein
MFRENQGIFRDKSVFIRKKRGVKRGFSGTKKARRGRKIW